MLTAFQCETVAYMTEYGDLMCPDCFDRGAEFARPIIRYSLDEWQVAEAYEWCANVPGWDYTDAVQPCGCEPTVTCAECGDELSPEFADPYCPNDPDNKEEV